MPNLNPQLNTENLTRQGKGRPKGSPNKTTQSLRLMIEAAHDEVGGKDYFAKQAIENPSAFMQLIGKILPKDVNAKIDGDMTITEIRHTIVYPDK